MWHQCYDFLTLQNRLKFLYNIKEFKTQGVSNYDRMLSTVCDKKYMLVKDIHGNDIYLTPKAYYKKNADKPIVDRWDYLTILDGICWIDQMIAFAAIRKSQGLRESYSLDAIAKEELGKEKLDYSGYTIKNLPWLNFPKFCLYNIMDNVLLMLLEKKNLDMDMVQRLQDITNTRKEKVFKKTVSLKNFVCKFAEEQGFVMGNNKNAQYGNDSDYFEKEYLNKAQLLEGDKKYIDTFQKKENFGAFVADPNLNDYCGIKDASGKSSMFLFKNVFDEDFSSLYPSIIRAYNLDKNTQIGKFFLLDSKIKERLIEDYNYTPSLFSVSKNEEASAGAETTSEDVALPLIDSLESHDWTRIGSKYFGMPSIEETINNLLLNFKQKENPNVN